MKTLILFAIPFTIVYFIFPYLIVALQIIFFGQIIDASTKIY